MKRSMLALALASLSGVLVCLPLSAVVAKPTQVEVVNADPIPVVSPPPPLWQGTPYIATAVVFGSGCAELESIPAGMVLFVQRVTASFNVAPGRNGIAAIGLVALGGNGQDFLYVPTFESGPVHQAFGVYDGYMGAIEVAQPTAVTPQACYFAQTADDLRGRIIVTGYLLPASQ